MTVIARSKLSGGTLRRRHRDARSRTPAGASAGPPVARISPAEAFSPARRRREAGAPQDQAVYSCGCGYVFEAPVSTSVDCPHCGGAQAW